MPLALQNNNAPVIRHNRKAVYYYRCGDLNDLHCPSWNNIPPRAKPPRQQLPETLTCSKAPAEWEILQTCSCSRLLHLCLLLGTQTCRCCQTDDVEPFIRLCCASIPEQKAKRIRFSDNHCDPFQLMCSHIKIYRRVMEFFAAASVM